MPLLFKMILIVIASVSAHEVQIDKVKAPAKPVALGTNLAFSRHEGTSEDYFFRQGKACAQVQIENDVQPYLNIGFPAGNSGIMLKWAPEPNLKLEVISDKGDPDLSLAPKHDNPRMNGVHFHLRATGVKRLVAKGFMLDSMRFIRIWRDTDQREGGNQEKLTLTDPHTLHIRQTYNEEHDYEIVLHNPDLIFKPEGDGFVLETGQKQDIRLDVNAWTSEKPLTPIPFERLFQAGFFDPEFAMLAYEEGFLAGFINYMTPFGRDTMISLALMMPVLQSEAIEAALAPLVEAINAHGEPPHEQEQSAYSFKVHGDFKTHYDYKMIDDRYMLAPLLERYFRSVPAARANAFLARKAIDGGTFRDALKRNLRLVLKSSAPFAIKPVAANLIRLRPGERVGNWRDSFEGLGHGRVPLDVNAALMPAALKGALYFWNSPDFGLEDEKLAHEAKASYAVWADHAPKLFQVHIPKAEAEKRAVAHANFRKIAPPKRMQIPKAGVNFLALSLNADGSPVKALNSDINSILLFGTPDAKLINEILDSAFRPYPLGLMTPVGLLISNAVYAPDDLKPLFGPKNYHGEDVWAFQQGMMAMGLVEQLKRGDLPPTVRENLDSHLKQMYELLRSTASFADKEYWTWRPDDAGKIIYSAGGIDKPCRPQLWSKATSFVYLYLQKRFGSADKLAGAD